MKPSYVIFYEGFVSQHIQFLPCLVDHIPKQIVS